MNNEFFANGTVSVGGKDMAFERRLIRGNFLIYIPRSFVEDKNIVSNYSYLFSQDKSPLSIAIKYTPVPAGADRDKMISHYFGGSADSTKPQTADHGVLYRETVTGSLFMSVYSLRFCVEEANGTLFGCFNCSADYKDDWKQVVLQMLYTIEPAE